MDPDAAWTEIMAFLNCKDNDDDDDDAQDSANTACYALTDWLNAGGFTPEAARQAGFTPGGVARLCYALGEYTECG